MDHRILNVVVLSAVTLVAFCQIATNTGEVESNNGVAWGNWSDWSNCSKPCGGGVTQRNRECIRLRNDTNATCVGRRVLYNMCNIQDCSDSLPDFRTEQCSKYNEKKFKGEYFNWVGFVHRGGECELKCMPKNEFFYVTFESKVVDGTRCNDYTNDVCINGTCVQVGCDMQLYSDATVDMCGVCRGDNSTCVKRSKLYPINVGAYDYVDVTTIPAGATSIRIKENGKTSVYIALTSNEENIINGNRIFSSPSKLKYRNSVLKYTRTDALNEILVDGPTDVPFDLKVFVFGGAMNDILLEYFVPDSYKELEKITEYQWVASKWGTCSKSCAAGSRARTAYCANKETGEKVQSFYCKNDQLPTLREKCNLQPCPARWYISQWAPCSKTCGRGLRTRRVHCVQTIAGGNINMLNFTECSGKTPKRVESCVENGTCPEWKAQSWSTCSKTCGEGIQTRVVECVNLKDNSVEVYKCSTENKPTMTRSCYNVPCGAKWISEEWGECSSKCGTGVRSRQVTCRTNDNIDVPNEYCDPDDEPTHFEECKSNGTCQPTWQSSAWSKCSANCGRGRQIRSVFCIVSDGDSLQRVSSSRCNGQEKPALTKRCYSQKPCHINYFVSSWGKCSASCGLGYQRRSVKCYADRRIDYTDEKCSKLRKPINFRTCSSIPCEGEDNNNKLLTPSYGTTTTSTPLTDSPAKVISLTGSRILHDGDNADFICKVSGYPTPKITWTLNDAQIRNPRFQFVDGGKRLIILAVTARDSGKLSCIAENKFDKSSSSIRISVSSSPKVEVLPKSQTLKEGDQLVIRCNATGSPSPRFQWVKDTFIFRGDNKRVILSTNRIIFKRVQLKDSGSYRCTAFNTAGSTSDSMKLTVQEHEGSKKVRVGDCVDDKTKANCLIVKREKICDIPYYKRVCCETCN